MMLYHVHNKWKVCIVSMKPFEQITTHVNTSDDDDDNLYKVDITLDYISMEIIQQTISLMMIRIQSQLCHFILCEDFCFGFFIISLCTMFMLNDAWEYLV